MTLILLLIRLVAVVEGFFNYKAYLARKSGVSYSRLDPPSDMMVTRRSNTAISILHP